MAIHCRSLLVLLAVLVAGCSTAPPWPTYDSQKAEETLVQALEAWKQGRVAALAKRVPPLRFEDEDYRNGFRLIRYQLEPRESPLRPFDDVEVLLFLRSRQGHQVEKLVSYQVALGPELAVLRSD